MATVRVSVIEARNLPVMDRISGLTDAYPKVKLGDQTQPYDKRTKHRTLTPFWGESYDFALADVATLQQDPIEVRLYDHDIVTRDDLIGLVFVDLNIMLTAGKRPSMHRWFPLYDSFNGLRGEIRLEISIKFHFPENPFIPQLPVRLVPPPSVFLEQAFVTLLEGLDNNINDQRTLLDGVAGTLAAMGDTSNRGSVMASAAASPLPEAPSVASPQSEDLSRKADLVDEHDLSHGDRGGVAVPELEDLDEFLSSVNLQTSPSKDFHSFLSNNGSFNEPLTVGTLTTAVIAAKAALSAQQTLKKVVRRKFKSILHEQSATHSREFQRVLKPINASIEADEERYHLVKKVQGVRIFTMSRLDPTLFRIERVGTLVEELLVRTDPEQTFRLGTLQSTRQLHESRQVLLFNLSGQARRQLASKVLQLNCNAVLGYRESFDIESYTIIVRAYGTPVLLSSVEIGPVTIPAIEEILEEEVRRVKRHGGSDGGSDEFYHSSSSSTSTSSSDRSRKHVSRRNRESMDSNESVDGTKESELSDVASSSTTSSSDSRRSSVSSVSRRHRSKNEKKYKRKQREKARAKDRDSGRKYKEEAHSLVTDQAQPEDDEGKEEHPTGGDPFATPIDEDTERNARKGSDLVTKPSGMTTMGMPESTPMSAVYFGDVEPTVASNTPLTIDDQPPGSFGAEAKTVEYKHDSFEGERDTSPKRLRRRTKEVLESRRKGKSRETKSKKNNRSSSKDSTSSDSSDESKTSRSTDDSKRDRKKRSSSAQRKKRRSQNSKKKKQSKKLHSDGSSSDTDTSAGSAHSQHSDDSKETHSHGDDKSDDSGNSRKKSKSKRRRRGSISDFSSDKSTDGTSSGGSKSRITEDPEDDEHVGYGDLDRLNDESDGEAMGNGTENQSEGASDARSDHKNNSNELDDVALLGELAAEMNGGNANAKGSAADILLLTLTSVPSGALIHLGGVVAAKSVKVVGKSRSKNIIANDRDAWWLEVRNEMKSNAKSFHCNAIIGYREETHYYNDTVILDAIGTAVVIDVSWDAFRSGPEQLYATLKEKFQSTNCCSLIHMYSLKAHSTLSAKKLSRHSRHLDALSIPVSNARRSGKRKDKKRDKHRSGKHKTGGRNHSSHAKSRHRLKGDHTNKRRHHHHSPSLQKIRKALKDRYGPNVLLCEVCGRRPVPSMMLATTSVPPELQLTGQQRLVEVRAAQSRYKKGANGESGSELARIISQTLQILEYRLHKELAWKLQLLGFNAGFDMDMKVETSATMMVATLSVTGCRVVGLPLPATPKIEIAQNGDMHHYPGVMERIKSVVMATQDHLDSVREQHSESVKFWTSQVSEVKSAFGTTVNSPKTVSPQQNVPVPLDTITTSNLVLPPSASAIQHGKYTSINNELTPLGQQQQPPETRTIESILNNRAHQGSESRNWFKFSEPFHALGDENHQIRLLRSLNNEAASTSSTSSSSTDTSSTSSSSGSSNSSRRKKKNHHSSSDPLPSDRNSNNISSARSRSSTSSDSSDSTSGSTSPSSSSSNSSSRVRSSRNMSILDTTASQSSWVGDGNILDLSKIPHNVDAKRTFETLAREINTSIQRDVLVITDDDDAQLVMGALDDLPEADALFVPAAYYPHLPHAFETVEPVLVQQRFLLPQSLPSQSGSEVVDFVSKCFTETKKAMLFKLIRLAKEKVAQQDKYLRMYEAGSDAVSFSKPAALESSDYGQFAMKIMENVANEEQAALDGSTVLNQTDRTAQVQRPGSYEDFLETLDIPYLLGIFASFNAGMDLGSSNGAAATLSETTRQSGGPMSVSLPEGEFQFSLLDYSADYFFTPEDEDLYVMVRGVFSFRFYSPEQSRAAAFGALMKSQPPTSTHKTSKPVPFLLREADLFFSPLLYQDCSLRSVEQLCGDDAKNRMGLKLMFKREKASKSSSRSGSSSSDSSVKSTTKVKSKSVHRSKGESSFTAKPTTPSSATPVDINNVAGSSEFGSPSKSNNFMSDLSKDNFQQQLHSAVNSFATQTRSSVGTKVSASSIPEIGSTTLQPVDSETADQGKQHKQSRHKKSDKEGKKHRSKKEKKTKKAKSSKRRKSQRKLKESLSLNSSAPSTPKAASIGVSAPTPDTATTPTVSPPLVSVVQKLDSIPHKSESQLSWQSLWVSNLHLSRALFVAATAPFSVPFVMATHGIVATPFETLNPEGTQVIATENEAEYLGEERSAALVDSNMAKLQLRITQLLGQIEQHKQQRHLHHSARKSATDSPQRKAISAIESHESISLAVSANSNPSPVAALIQAVAAAGDVNNIPTTQGRPLLRSPSSGNITSPVTPTVPTQRLRATPTNFPRIASLNDVRPPLAPSSASPIAGIIGGSLPSNTSALLSGLGIARGSFSYIQQYTNLGSSNLEKSIQVAPIEYATALIVPNTILSCGGELRFLSANSYNAPEQQQQLNNFNDRSVQLFEGASGSVLINRANNANNFSAQQQQAEVAHQAAMQFLMKERQGLQDIDQPTEEGEATVDFEEDKVATTPQGKKRGSVDGKATNFLEVLKRNIAKSKFGSNEGGRGLLSRVTQRAFSKGSNIGTQNTTSSASAFFGSGKELPYRQRKPKGTLRAASSAVGRQWRALSSLASERLNTWLLKPSKAGKPLENATADANDVGQAGTSPYNNPLAGFWQNNNAQADQEVYMTPLEFLPGASIVKYLGLLSQHFIREDTVANDRIGAFFVKTESEIHAVVASLVRAMGGNALLDHNLRYHEVYDRANSAFLFVTVMGQVAQVTFDFVPAAGYGGNGRQLGRPQRQALEDERFSWDAFTTDQKGEAANNSAWWQQQWETIATYRERDQQFSSIRDVLYDDVEEAWFGNNTHRPPHRHHREAATHKTRANHVKRVNNLKRRNKAHSNLKKRDFEM